jgi:hypothetical protein
MSVGGNTGGSRQTDCPCGGISRQRGSSLRSRLWCTASLLCADASLEQCYATRR